jgi:hypothetical protein
MKYDQWVECHEQNEFKPRVAIDKHWPSFRGFAAAGYGPASLCRFHIRVMPVAADPGLVLAPLAKGEHAVVAFSGNVPKVVSGTPVQAGDVLLGVTVTADGCLPPSTEPATIKFRRQRGGGTQRVGAGGRRAKLQPKFSRAPVMLGGSPAVARPKPQCTKASALPAAVISPVCLAHASSMSVAMSACGGTTMATTALSLRLSEWLKEKTAEEQQQIEEGLDTATYVD